MSSRVLAGKAARIDLVFVDQDGTPKDAAGNLSVEITRADGTILDVTDTTKVADQVGQYFADLSATHTADLDTLTCRWTDSVGGSTQTTRVDIVGGYYFGIDEARETDPTLRDGIKYPTTRITRARQMVESECERICQQAFVLRFGVMELSGDGSSKLLLDEFHIRRIRWVKVDGVALADITTITVDHIGLVTYADGYFPVGKTVTIGFEHGWLEPPPDIVDAAIVRVRETMNSKTSQIPDRATSYSSGDVSYDFATSNSEGWETGNRYVDVIYGGYRNHVPVIA